jgi:hypothetical protein
LNSTASVTSEAQREPAHPTQSEELTFLTSVEVRDWIEAHRKLGDGHDEMMYDAMCRRPWAVCLKCHRHAGEPTKPVPPPLPTPKQKHNPKTFATEEERKIWEIHKRDHGLRPKPRCPWCMVGDTIWS